ncbi:MAG: acyl-CoA thioesterase [Pseudomonadota bacterium]
MAQTPKPQGELVICVVATPADTNPNGDIFGGWLVSQMDMGAGVAARRRARCRIVTVAIDEMVFIKPVYVGDLVACYAELVHVGRSSMRFNMQTWTLGVDDDHEQVAEGIFTFVAIDEQGRPQSVDR